METPRPMAAPLPECEAQRLAALQSLGILDSLPEQSFDDIVQLAAQVCGAPISMISFVDRDREWFKAKVGVTETEAPRQFAFCAHGILGTDIFEVPNASADPRFAANPAVTGDAGIRFYAGVPLVSEEGAALGMLCVKDRIPRKLSEDQKSALRALGRQVMAQLELQQHLKEVQRQMREREAAERSLRESEERFRQLAENVAAVFWMMSPDLSEVLYVSPAYEKIWGRSVEQLIRRPQDRIDAILPEDRTRVGDALRRLVAGERAVSCEFRIARPDQETRWVNSRWVQVRDETGRLIRIAGVDTDITERKGAEERQHRQQAEIQALFDLLPALVWFKDTHNNFIKANQTAADAAGLPLAAFEGAPCASIYPDEAEQYYADDLEVIRSGRPKLGIVELIEGKDGSKSWIQTDKVPYRDREGRVAGIVVMAQDVTAQKRNEEWLRLLSSSVEQSTDSVLITDASPDEREPRIRFANAAFCALTGYGHAELIGRSPTILVGPLTHRLTVARMRRKLARGESYRGETINYRKDGGRLELEWQVAPIRNPEGVVTNYVALLRDIGARKAAERELVQARTEALESARLKSRFLANMSHELRTPLNAINGLSATLLEQNLPQPAQEAATTILQCGETLLGLIQTILNHASLEAGKTTLDCRAFNLEAVVLKALRIGAEAAHRKNLDLDYYLDPGTPAKFTGDPVRLQQIVLNLLSNAVKFTDRGRVYLRLRSRPRADGTWELRFAIADTGIGLARPVLAKLFQPFSQVDDSATRRHEGTGLGLAIVKSLVELMGGRIEVISRPGRGSVFRFFVRLSADAAEPRIFAAGADPRLVGRRLLIAESDELRRRQLIAIARAWQMEPLPWAGGSEPVPKVKFDFVVRGHDFPAFQAGSCPAVVVMPSGLSGRTPVALGEVTVDAPFAAADLSGAWLTPPRPARGTAPATSAVPGPLGARLPLRILGADDMQANREVLRYLCGHLGYEVDLVENGAAVLERLETKAYDLILLDVQMPVLDGLETARRIRKQYANRPDAPRLVAITASVQPGDRERCLAAGMDDYLSKPILPKDVAGCFERLFVQPSGLGAQPRLNGVAEAPLLDREHLRSIAEGLDPGPAASFIHEMALATRLDLDEIRPRLAEACAARSSQAVAGVVHALRGCISCLGWARLGSLCAETSVEVHAGRFQSWNELPAKIDDLIRKSAVELEAEMARLRAKQHDSLDVGDAEATLPIQAWTK